MKLLLLGLYITFWPKKEGKKPTSKKSCQNPVISKKHSKTYTKAT